MTSQTLVFNNTEFNIIDQGGAPWLRASNPRHLQPSRR